MSTKQPGARDHRQKRTAGRSGRDHVKNKDPVDEEHAERPTAKSKQPEMTADRAHHEASRKSEEVPRVPSASRQGSKSKDVCVSTSVIGWRLTWFQVRLGAEKDSQK